MSFGLNEKPRPFPKFAFEVETTPEFRRALLRLYQLRDFDTALYVVADEAKRSLFEKRNPASLPSICVPEGDASEGR